MKSTIIGGLAAMTFGIGAAMAQNAPATPAAAAPAATPAAGATAAATTSGDFIAQQPLGVWRAPKLVGVAVYDSNNKDIGKIADLLLDKDGKVTAVVIGVGGFLGIGSKDVAMPFSAIHWQTEQRTVAVNEPAPADKAIGETAPGGHQKTQPVPVEQTEAYQGYPDRAVIEMSQAQLKAAPDFKYVSSPASSETAAAPASGTMANPMTTMQKPATTQKQ